MKKQQRIKENRKTSVHIPEHKMYFLFSRLMKKDRKNMKTPHKSQNKKYVHIQARLQDRKDKNESKALPSPEWNPQQKAGNFSVLLKVVTQVSVKGI